jgi:hypothetical protein
MLSSNGNNQRNYREMIVHIFFSFKPQNHVSPVFTPGTRSGKIEPIEVIRLSGGGSLPLIGISDWNNANDLRRGNALFTNSVRKRLTKTPTK